MERQSKVQRATIEHLLFQRRVSMKMVGRSTSRRGRGKCEVDEGRARKDKTSQEAVQREPAEQEMVSKEPPEIKWMMREAPEVSAEPKVRAQGAVRLSHGQKARLISKEEAQADRVKLR